MGCGDPKRLLDVPPNVGFPPKILEPLVLPVADRLEPPNKDFVWLADEAGVPNIEVVGCPPNKDEGTLD